MNFLREATEKTMKSRLRGRESSEHYESTEK